VRRIAVLDAPSNLGLRPPTATSVPGCAKAPGALRDHGLLTKLGARDAGCLTAPRYDPGDWRPGDGVAHAAQIAAYSRRLADRIGGILDAGEFPVILGGDCSILLGSGLAMHRLGEAVGGRIGLVFVDGHSDFRHPGNASYVGAAAGEDLALVTGRGQADLASIEGRRPYFRDVDVVVMGLRAQDEYRLDLQAAGIVTRPVPALRVEGAARSAQWARDQLVDCAGYWLHVDVDVLDPAVMPAVDAPTPGGIAFPELEILLAGLVESPHCLGVEITVFDPDYDPDGAYAAEIATTVAAGLAAARTVALRPDLIAARADLAKPAAGPETTAEPETLEDADAGSGEPSANAAAADQVGEGPPANATGDAAAGLASLLRPSADADDALRASLLRPSADGDDVVRASLSRPSAEPADRGPMLRPAGDAAAAVRASLLRPRTKADRVGRSSLLRRPADAEADGPGSLLRPAADAEAERNGEFGADQPAVGGSDPHAADDSFITRPLGQAPLLDSTPLPATRPGMLRPRPADDHPAEDDPADDHPAEDDRADDHTADDFPADDHPADDFPADDFRAPGGFSLPVQRPAFDLGSGSPADIA
jgi:arginase